VIDGHTVLTGSFNFTNQAEHENAENLLILRHYADLAAAYRANFAAHKEHARAPEVNAAPAAPARHAA
jgi:phosphatidylserine/phosphatidylglycerophosphate/cardiolipin synthase-like enzyme